MNPYARTTDRLRDSPKTWLVTGVAGFIGSNLLETLLKLDQTVIGLDNFSTGSRRNIDAVRRLTSEAQWGRFRFNEGDICSFDDCRRACVGVDYALHQAAIGSVPRSLSDPIATNAANISGFLNMLVAAREAGIKRFVYAASSSTYGDHPHLPKVEETIGRPLSPYAVTKVVNELYADVFARCYGFDSIGLRYFNVFGPRQDPDGAYAAIIPKWTKAMIKGEPVFINGDGATSRDFTFVDNAIQMNLLAATVEARAAVNQVFNVAVGERTTLNALHEALRGLLAPRFPHLLTAQPQYREFRAGDVLHSQADMTKARTLLGYEPSHDFAAGLALAAASYVAAYGDATTLA